MDWLTLALAILACYRLARLVTIDEGPGGLFLKLRVKAGAYDYGPNGRPQTNLGRGIACPHCAGIWLALGLAFLFPVGWYTLLYWLAIAGGQSVLQAVSE